MGGKPTAYVCEKGFCRLPAIAPEKLAAQIATARPYRDAPLGPAEFVDPGGGPA